MILNSSQIIELQLVKNIADLKYQTQPCGIDFTLKRICKWNSRGIIDFDNTLRQLPEYEYLEFDDKIHLGLGGYLVEFNEIVQIPLNLMCSIYTRSSLFRSGATLHGGVIDPGYSGVTGALMQVWNEQGITLFKNARLGQCVFIKLEYVSVLGYEGVYQNAEAMF